MEKLQLALLTQWAEEAGLGGLRGRKRMQKVIYFLQQVGCPIGAEYTLHHYGPYSRCVANITDEMVAEGLLLERGGGGGQYEYELDAKTRSMIDQARACQGESVSAFEKFKQMAVELLQEDLWTLELGSTILYFFRTQRDSPNWERALVDACRYKGVAPMLQSSQDARVLAERLAPVAA
ncbi:MAG: hypothetical protein ACTS3F_04710 [Phycisphaerales bacterium]